MKKVFHILNTGNFSGAEHVVLTIIQLEKDVEHIYVSPNGPISEVLSKQNIKHLQIPKLSYSNLKRLIELEKPDIIHAHDFKASVLSSLFSRIIHRRNGVIVSHLHKNDPKVKKITLKSISYAFSLLFVDRVLVVSKAVIDEYAFPELLRRKTLILGNVVETTKILNDAKKDTLDEYDISYIARISDEKNPERFIEIVKLVKQYLPNVKVCWVGSGELESQMRRKILSENLSENIDMVGFKTNPYPYIFNSKVGVLTSKWEGFGLGVLESMLMSKPIVATPVGGLPKLVDSQNGVLSDDNNILVKEIVELLSDEEYYKNKSVASRLKATEVNDTNRYQRTLQIAYDI